MLRVSHVLAVLLAVGVAASSAPAQTYSSATTALIEHFASRVALEDFDHDGVLTDLDFMTSLLEGVFDAGLQDENCDGDLTEADAVICVARELAALASDFDRNGVVSNTDVEHVVLNLGTSNAPARAGDVNGDKQVDAIDLLETCDRMGAVLTLNPVEAAYDILEPFLDLDESLRTIELPGNEPCPAPELCGSATCKVQCVDPTTGQKWTYRLFMVGFCGSQFEATACCDEVAPFACNCSASGFTLTCWVETQGVYVVCLLAIPG